MIKGIIKNYGKILLGFRFWIGILCVFILFQLDAEIPIFFDEYRWSVLEETSDLKIILISSIFYGMYMYMLCMVATIGFGMQFYDEWKAGIVPQIVKKMGIKKYSMLYIILAAVSGGGIAAIGFILFAVYMGTYVPLFNQSAAQTHMHNMVYKFTLCDGSGLEYVIVMSILMFLVGALSAVIAMCISTISENKYFIIVSPYLLYRVYVEICKIIEIPNNYRIDYYLFGREDIGNSFGKFIIIVCFALIIIIVIGHYQFTKGVQRRLAYGKY